MAYVICDCNSCKQLAREYPFARHKIYKYRDWCAYCGRPIGMIKGKVYKGDKAVELFHKYSRVKGIKYAQPKGTWVNEHWYYSNVDKFNFNGRKVGFYAQK